MSVNDATHPLQVGAYVAASRLIDGPPPSDSEMSDEAYVDVLMQALVDLRSAYGALALRLDVQSLNRGDA